MRSERASAMILAPAGMLILILLAAISADSALAFMGQRELQNEAAGAANDAATMSISDSSVNGLQAGGNATPDPASANAIVQRAMNHAYSGGLQFQNADVDVDNNTVTVTATGRVHYIFANAIPGVNHYADIKVQSAAQLQFGN